MKCPKSEHAGSRVKLDGTYGTAGHRRQRYECSPRGGERPHVFTELLPREESWQSSCGHCERALERREGAKAPRHYQFVARGIAEALQALGTGDSHMRAARVARGRARRLRLDGQTGELRESAHGQLLADWSIFLGSLPGHPERIVCDAHGGMLAAIASRWPLVEVQQCEWHLQHALDRLLAKETRNDPGAELAELREAASGALCGPAPWRQLVRAARFIEDESLERWIAAGAATIERQFARRALTPRRPDMPLTTAALEQISRPIVAALYPRRYGLKNRERLNRLLMLLQLHINGDDDVHAYARGIRRHLGLNEGRPLVPRRAIADPVGAPSLR